MLAGGMERLLWVFVLGFWVVFFFTAQSEWEEGRENKFLREEEAVSECKGGVTAGGQTEEVNAAALG